MILKTSILTAIRAILLGITGILVMMRVVPEGLEETLVDAAMSVIGGILILWGAFAAHRAKRQREGGE